MSFPPSRIRAPTLDLVVVRGETECRVGRVGMCTLRAGQVSATVNEARQSHRDHAVTDTDRTGQQSAPTTQLMRRWTIDEESKTDTVTDLQVTARNMNTKQTRAQE